LFQRDKRQAELCTLSDQQVSNISPDVDEKKLRDFFEFCGTIDRVEFIFSDFDSKTATEPLAVITFEKPDSVQTALLLQRSETNHTNVPSVLLLTKFRFGFLSYFSSRSTHAYFDARQHPSHRQANHHPSRHGAVTIGPSAAAARRAGRRGPRWAERATRRRRCDETMLRSVAGRLMPVPGSGEVLSKLRAAAAAAAERARDYDAKHGLSDRAAEAVLRQYLPQPPSRPPSPSLPHPPSLAVHLRLQTTPLDSSLDPPADTRPSPNCSSDCCPFPINW
jgi:hypothetical protein